MLERVHKEVRKLILARAMGLPRSAGREDRSLATGTGEDIMSALGQRGPVGVGHAGYLGPLVDDHNLMEDMARLFFDHWQSGSCHLPFGQSWLGRLVALSMRGIWSICIANAWRTRRLLGRGQLKKCNKAAEKFLQNSNPNVVQFIGTQRVQRGGTVRSIMVLTRRGGCVSITRGQSFGRGVGDGRVFASLEGSLTRTRSEHRRRHFLECMPSLGMPTLSERVHTLSWHALSQRERACPLSAIGHRPS